MMRAGQQQQNGRVVLPSFRTHKGPPRPLTAGMLTRMNIPRRYWTSTLEKVTDAEFKRYVVEYLVGIRDALDRGIGMILNGDHDTGKTAISALCLKQARRVGATGLFVTADEYMRAYIQRIQFDDATSISDRCRDVDLLVLDDMSREAVRLETGDGSAAMLESLIKDRCSARRSTIITTNLDMSGFEKMYGRSMFGMLAGSSAIVHVTVGSFRSMEASEVESFFNLDEGKSRRMGSSESCSVDGALGSSAVNPFNRKA